MNWDYRCIKANLHSHTNFSDGWWYNPEEAYLVGKRNGLDLLGVTDHGEWLNEWKWNRYKTDVRDTENNPDMADFIPLFGFEWTSDYYGHINVLGSRTYCGIDGRGNGDPPNIVPHLREFYDWCIHNLDSSFGGEIVCQFNHPSTHSSIHFNDFNIGSSLDLIKLTELFSLCEVNTPIPNGCREDHLDRFDEFYYRKALRKGWKLAPVINEDNHSGHYGETQNRTGIWLNKPDAYSNHQACVLDALRRKRTFITKKDVSMLLKYWWQVTEDGNGTPYIMGQTFKRNFGTGKDKQIELKIDARSNDPIGDIYLVKIRNDDQADIITQIDNIKGIACQINIPYTPENSSIVAVYVKIARPGSGKKEGGFTISSPIFIEA